MQDWSLSRAQRGASSESQLLRCSSVTGLCLGPAAIGDEEVERRGGNVSQRRRAQSVSRHGTRPLSLVVRYSSAIEGACMQQEAVIQQGRLHGRDGASDADLARERRRNVVVVTAVERGCLERRACAGHGAARHARRLGLVHVDCDAAAVGSHRHGPCRLVSPCVLGPGGPPAHVPVRSVTERGGDGQHGTERTSIAVAHRHPPPSPASRNTWAGATCTAVPVSGLHRA